MPLTLGTNISALKAQRRLGEATSGVQRSFERLASGLRINRASDDAAGLSVSSSLEVKARIFGRAALNISDAQSLLIVTDSTLSGVGEILTRMSELAQQAANGTFSSAQRTNLTTEFAQLSSEIERISGSTQFNNLNLLDGGRSSRAATSAMSGLATVQSAFISSDGRFEVASVTNGFTIRDRDTGDVRTVSAGLGNITVAGTLDNGDIVFSDSSSNIYRYRYEEQSTTKIVNSAGASASSLLATISGDGSTLVFQTSGSNYQDGGSALTGASSNGDGLYRVFKLDLASGGVRQVRPAGAFSAYDSIHVSQSGSFISVVEAGTSLTTIDTRGAQFTSRSTAGQDSATAIGILDNGVSYFYESAVGIDGLYAFDFTANTTRLLRYVSSAFFAAKARFSADGSTLSFLDTANYVGQNSTGVRQLYQLDLQTGSIQQRTNYTTQSAIGAGPAAISADGLTIVVRSAAGTGLDEIDASANNLDFNFEVGAGAQGSISTSLRSLLSTLRGIDSFTLSSAVAARSALYRMNKNIEAVAQSRSVVGASMSRLAIAQNLVTTQRDEARSAQSRIRDIDVADEAGRVAVNQIRQQAASAVLAQANQQPALVLQLLR
jgi:flagellin